MNLKQLIFSGAVTVLLGIGVSACNENPTSTTPAPLAPTGLYANSAGSTSVNLRWTAPVDTGTIAYTVSFSGATSGSVDVVGTSTTINGLTANSAYTFSVVSTRGGKSSTPVTVMWAGADRLTTEPGTATTLRMYEFASSNGSALTIDPAKGGPKNVSTSASKNPDLTTCQLAIYLTPANEVQIGPAFGNPNYANQTSFDPNVYSSAVTYIGLSLDDVFNSKPVDQLIDAVNGNAIGFTIANNDAAAGHAFYVRTGTTGNYHFVKVFLKKGAGGFIQGTSPNRYAEVELSYQSAANTPYAKSVVRKDSPVGATAQYHYGL